MKSTYKEKSGRVITFNLTPESREKIRAASVSMSDYIEALLRAAAVGLVRHTPHYSRKDPRTISIRLTEYGHSLLETQVDKAGISRSDYLESLIRSVPDSSMVD